MKPIECKCFNSECGFGSPFLVYVPPEVENRLTGTPYLNNCGEAEGSGNYTCPKGHVGYDICVMGSGVDRVNELLVGTWSNSMDKNENKEVVHNLGYVDEWPEWTEYCRYRNERYNSVNKIVREKIIPLPLPE